VIVLDASAVVDLLLGKPAAPLVATRIRAADGSVHTPQLMPLEVASSLRRMVALDVITPERGVKAIERLVELPGTRHEHDHLLPRIWSLRDNLTPYDASYVALAEALGATLVTTDARLARAPGHTARVELLT
jgi:predicted nucleic acid-binding protein